MATTGPLTIAASRVSQINQVVHDMAAGFTKPIAHTTTENTISREDFLKPYHEDVHWYDHAFLVYRVGHDAVVGLQKAFRHCNQPFDVEVRVSGQAAFLDV